MYYAALLRLRVSSRKYSRLQLDFEKRICLMKPVWVGNIIGSVGAEALHILNQIEGSEDVISTYVCVWLHHYGNDTA